MVTLKVTNFQSIKEIELQVEGLTVLLAPTHSGKTALVRAMETLLTSEWLQEAYLRTGTNTASISLMDITDTIEFTRKGAVTTYKVNGASFSKLGRKVPKEVATAGYGEVSISESATEVTTILPQIQTQFEGPYQDTIKPVALTQLLGSFTNLIPYHTAQDKAKKQQADIRRELDRLSKDKIKLTAISGTLHHQNSGSLGR